MPRKSVADREEILAHPIILRMNGATFKRLEKLLAESSCKSIGEVARKILTDGGTGADQKGTQVHRD